MRARLSTLLSVIGAVTVLVLAGNTVAIATTGHGLLLGKINTANRATVLSRTTPGTALVVKTKSSANSPFAVNGKGKVANLNADVLDGIDSSAMANRTTVYEGVPNSNVNQNGFTMSTPPVPAGNYLVSISGLFHAATTPGPTCQTSVVGSSTNMEQLFVPNSTGVYTLSTNGTLEIPATSAVSISCSGGSAIYYGFVGDSVRISLTRIGVLTKVNGSFTYP